MPKTRRCAVFLAALSLAAGAATQALAWGSTGHRLIGRLAMQALPASVPGFLRTPQAVEEIGELAREPDRSRGAGQPHDADLDPGHFVDLEEGGHVFTPQGPHIGALPRSRGDYDVALARAGIDPFKAGFLPYNLMDGYQQLVKDFAWWRVEKAAERSTRDRRDRAWIAADRTSRERLIVRDLGYWAHFVGDASQPMHVSIHYNGWGDYPNPRGYTQERIHTPFEGPYVHDNVTAEAVRAAMAPPGDCGPTIQTCTVAYLTTTLGQTEPLYALRSAGGFQPGDPRGRAFATARVAAGASALRDLILKAWRESDRGQIGYGDKIITVRDAEAGRPVPMGILYGED
jgi:hypothetical protein